MTQIILHLLFQEANRCLLTVFSFLKSWFVLLCIFTGSVLAEKTSAPASWNQRLENQRTSLECFQLELESWRFDVREATSSVSFEEGRQFLKIIPEYILQCGLGENTTDEMVVLLGKEIRTLFGVDIPITEAEFEVHQRDQAQGYYRVWEKVSGTLSLYDQRGTWTQDKHEISLGPVPGQSEIEIYLARLGLFIPEAATRETVLSITPEAQTDTLVYRIDLEGSRFRFECRPWLGTGLVQSICEASLWQDKEQGFLEERMWFPLPTMGPHPQEKPLPEYPLLGVEFQYQSNTAIEAISLLRIRSLRTKPITWSPFPRERPPFGHPVLDYRFKPEVEFRFGFME